MFVVKCITILCLAVVTYAHERPHFITPCHITDQECIRTSALKAFPLVVQGNKELGIASSDPLELKSVNGDNGDLKLKFKNMTVKGLSKCKIIKIERPSRLKIDLDMICPIIASGDYILGGTLLLVPVEGDDKFEIKMDKLEIKTSSKLKIVTKNDKEYYKIASFDFKYDALEKVHFHFHNLFHGDKAKADPINKVLDASWKEIISGIGYPVLHDAITAAIKNIGGLYQHIPCNEFELQ